MKTTPAPLPTPTATRLIPAAKWDQFHPWPSVGALRFHVYNAPSNGMAEHGVVKRIGKRVLIDEAAFFRWIDATAAKR